jgi:hypothetical protein
MCVQMFNVCLDSRIRISFKAILDGFGGLWFPSSRVQTRPKPLDFSGVKILSMPSFGGEDK